MNRTPIPKRRRARRGPWRSEAYRRWIASQPCMICGNPETQAAHTERGGMSMKGSDASCVPLCVRHHLEFDGKIRNGSVSELQRSEFQEAAAVFYFRWRNVCRLNP